MGVATVLGFVLPALAYCLFIERYSVNVLVADQWGNVSLARKGLFRSLECG